VQEVFSPRAMVPSPEPAMAPWTLERRLATLEERMARIEREIGLDVSMIRDGKPSIFWTSFPEEHVPL